MDDPSVFSAFSPQAREVRALLWGMLGVAGIIFVLVAGVVLYASFRYRARTGGALPRQDFGNARLEIAWTVIPFLLLVGVAGFAARTMQVLHVPSDATPDLIIVGHQWWWEVRYPNSGVVTANEIHIPTGRPLVVALESADVIHSFWIPQLAPKTDMIPGRTNHTLLQANQAGTYLGACSEFCGNQHAWMRLQVIAHEPSSFANWLSVQQQPAAAPTGDASLRGQRLLNTLACGTCHTVRGTPNAGQAGPDLTHIASRQTIGAGVLELTEDNLTQWLRNPAHDKPGVNMPNFKLTEPQLQDITTYLMSLR